MAAAFAAATHLVPPLRAASDPAFRRGAGGWPSPLSRPSSWPGGSDTLIGRGGQDGLHGNDGADVIDSVDGAPGAVFCGAGQDSVASDAVELLRLSCETRS